MPASPNPLIRIEQLDKVFTIKGQSFTALNQINLDIYPQEIFGIIGMSGAGKSTLVRCINFLERPTAGEVYFEGTPLSQLAEKDLLKVRQQMGMIFQQFNLLMQKTALENVMFPLEIAGIRGQKAKDRAKELLEIVGLADRLYAYPAQLSGGQKQRVAIARALATDPKVLLCDEATSALDPETTRSILQLLKDLNRNLGITVIIITHEMAVIEEVCQRLAIIDNHQIVEVGSVADVFTNPKTDIARRLISSDREIIHFDANQGQALRIVFDGSSSYQPVISQMILDLKETVNILYADMKDMDGIAYGEMIIQVAAESNPARIAAYLESHGVKVQEVEEHV